MTLQQFLTRHTLHLTLTNDWGDTVYIGEVSDVKPRKRGNYLKFPVKVIPESLYPYTQAILHDKGTIYSAIKFLPVRVTSGMIVELVVS